MAIDSQYDDAQIALDKPGHIAENPVDVEAFHRAVRQTSLVPKFLSDINYPALFTYLGILGFALFLIRALVKG
ncbi:hypothetical protein ACVW0Y_001203 [Pseudomonas sp. TE3786]